MASIVAFGRTRTESVGLHLELANQIRVSLAVGSAVAIATVGLLSAWVIRQSDQEAADALRAMLVRGIENSVERHGRNTLAHARWDAGYRAYVRGEKAWLDANMGAATFDTNRSELVAIVNPDWRIEYAWAAPDTSWSLAADAVVAAAKVGVEGAAPSIEAARPFVARAGDDVIFGSAARLAPTDGSVVNVTSLPVLIEANRVLPERIDGFGATYLVKDLHVIDEPAPGLETLPIPMWDQKPIAYLAWTAPAPALGALEAIASPLIVSLFVFVGLMVLIGSRAKRLAVALARAARKDYLTGLDNRKGLSDFLDRAENKTSCARGEMAVIAIDVNGFKAVNDTVGHPGGDFVLRALGQRLEEVLQSSARLARMGGNAFLVAVAGEDSRHVAQAAQTVRSVLAQPFEVQGIVFDLSAAVGYARGSPGIAPEELIRRADHAMFVAKRSKTPDPVPYDLSMETDALERKRMETRLRAGLAHGELRVVYQPILRLNDLTVDGIEALLRWRSSEIGDVPTDILIRVAEESGLIRDIGYHVLERVCQDMRRWPGTKVSVNLSPAQLLDAKLVDRVRTTLERHRVAPAQIQVELTETVLLDDPAAAAQRLSDLRALGISTALDDFGVGFASVGSLRSFPIDRVKIDRSFLDGIERPTGPRDLLRSLIGLARAMGLTVVCEGVETPGQAAVIRQLGCELGQGYLFSYPLEADDLEARLKSGASFAPVAMNVSAI